jgi:hypothetical protein
MGHHAGSRWGMAEALERLERPYLHGSGTGHLLSPMQMHQEIAKDSCRKFQGLRCL